MKRKQEEEVHKIKVELENHREEMKNLEDKIKLELAFLKVSAIRSNSGQKLGIRLYVLQFL